MPVIEVISPYSPFREDTSAPIVYLAGQSLLSDSWPESAVRMINRYYSQNASDLYVANQFSPAGAESVDEHNAWKDKYRVRALDNGAILIWLSSYGASKPRNREIKSILDQKHSNNNLPITCGTPELKMSFKSFKRIVDEFAEYKITVQGTLKATVQDALSYIPA